MDNETNEHAGLDINILVYGYLKKATQEGGFSHAVTDSAGNRIANNGKFFG
ncbi:hypothetical protein [Paenibacillus harenae]|uniref:Uncharacterized protein n=1 Tax=Paenibacillus harenae TaxID=306543 RepID=A0ABT9U0Y6_PAEHA|nr:hypothetical protein [Paenibacillus harenae]MDQ0113297.1 hypothetical protein [Paenibacillus harenae]